MAAMNITLAAELLLEVVSAHFLSILCVLRPDSHSFLPLSSISNVHTVREQCPGRAIRAL